jgi:hypothetical protein
MNRHLLLTLAALLLALFAGIGCIRVAANPARTPSLAGQTPQLDGATAVAQGTFPSPACDGKLQRYVVYASAQAAADKPLPMVVYVRGLPGEQIGMVSDEELIKGFLADGLLVAMVDYQGLAAWGGVGRTTYDECAILMSIFPREEKTSSSRRKLIADINCRIADDTPKTSITSAAGTMFMRKKTASTQTPGNKGRS